MARQQKLPRRLQPMLATLVDRPFDDRAWAFETKWDGFRMIAEIKRGVVKLFSRNGQVITGRYKGVAEALQRIRRDCVLDGELVALDRRGVSRFQLLQNALRTRANLQYRVFDIMFLDGKDLRRRTLLERKQRLRAILATHRMLKYSGHRFEHGTRYFAEARRRKEEGIMAKRAASPYLSGRRTMEWQKIKTSARQEVVVAGYTRPRRSRKYFGSLVLAVRKGAGWQYAGHAGTGFDAAALKSIYTRLQPLRTANRPFRDKIRYEDETTWVRPRLVCEVKFTEWTQKGEMRHPAFIGMRDDKKAEEVVRE
jgi:bifunctional non-homologous end joining protein LigD